MLKKNKVIAKIIVLALCTNSLQCIGAFGVEKSTDTVKTNLTEEKNSIEVKPDINEEENITEVTTGSAVTVIDTVSNEEDFEFDEATGTITGYHPTKTEPEIKIPSKIKNVTVKIIADSAFCESDIKAIDIPETVEVIGKKAFKNCSSLNKVTLHDGLKNIGECAFDYCSELTIINIPDTVTDIGKGAFELTGLESISIPESVTKIDDSTFWECMNLTDVKLPNTITSIGSGAFFGTRLESIVLPDTLEEIGEYSFAYSLLKEITIPNNAKTIGYKAFHYCKYLKTIYIPGDVTYIGDGAFNAINELNYYDVHFYVNSQVTKDALLKSGARADTIVLK